MEDIILSYLSLYKKCYVPGLGTFTVEKKTSVVVNNQLAAPAIALRFVEGKAAPDQQFLSFVATRLFSDEVLAIQQLHDFAEKIRQKTAAGITFAGFGHFTTAQGQLTCTPLEFKGETLDIAIAYIEEEQSGSETFQTTPAKDYWFIYALVLIITGLAAIYYYYS